ncbi:unnamed protein product [Clonostachys rosea]|uniref:AMP-dependent synthetase/ligase domain-containing protein n=1 Tax=Bionectria ochroleuca TaxID=29856 RepID=A0ABY6UR32_BIOOC|nr:unnamed protein product [Clonostachys rosea]
MVFYPPSWVPDLPDIPDSISLEDFLNNEKHGRHAIHASRNPFTCGLTGKTYSAQEASQRTDHLARAIRTRFSFNPDEGTEWDRVLAIFSLNTIDYISFALAVHRCNGIVTPASAAYSAPELEHQLRSSGAKGIFTCVPLLETALRAAKAVGIAEDAIFLLPVPGFSSEKLPFQTVDDLIVEGKRLPAVEPLRWVKGQGARQTAFLSYSSGTSGLPKAVKVSHRNVIANVIQMALFERVARDKLGVKTQVVLGVLPLSHIYGLVLVGLVSCYRGDEVVVLPRFDLDAFLAAVQRFKIEQLDVVPPILIQIITNQAKCDKFDLSSVRVVFSGAAPLGSELTYDILRKYPKWHVVQGYGMTESSPLITSTSELDVLVGSSGSLIPGFKAKVIDADGNEVVEYDKRGELLVQSPAVVIGYLNNEKANAETFVWHEDGRWLKTGDEVLVRRSEQGHDHFFIVDRIKELIKVNGHQVAPAELEAHLLIHPFVADCAVIQVHDPRAGEVPKAFVVKSKEGEGESDEKAIASITKHVEDHKARHKWLKGGVEFIETIPKSASGKILRRMLRDLEKDTQRSKGPKL